MVAAVMTWYNTGLLGGERDAYGSQCVATLKELTYPKLWYYVDPTKPRPRILEPWAHPNQTRDKILSTFRESVFSHSFLTRDKQLLLEMGAFTWQKNHGRRETMKVSGKGQKDDLVIAAAGANFIAPSAAGSYTKEQNTQPTVVVGANGIVLHREYPNQQRKPWLR
jgi:hypothetical protein